jgi:hypothetical protein
MHSAAPKLEAVHVYQIVLGLVICQVLTVIPFFLWQGYPARLLEMLP